MIALIQRVGTPVDPGALRTLLKAAGTNPLMFPETWLEVDALPKLGSGNNDFTVARQMAGAIPDTACCQIPF